MAEGLPLSPFVWEKENVGMTPTKADAALKAAGSVSGLHKMPTVAAYRPALITSCAARPALRGIQQLHRTLAPCFHVPFPSEHALQDSASHCCLGQQILKRDRAVLGDLGGPARAATTVKRQKTGSRLAKRRVSFAPDDQLKTMHLYTKVRCCMARTWGHVAQQQGCLVVQSSNSQAQPEHC